MDQRAFPPGWAPTCSALPPTELCLYPPADPGHDHTRPPAEPHRAPALHEVGNPTERSHADRRQMPHWGNISFSLDWPGNRRDLGARVRLHFLYQTRRRVDIEARSNIECESSRSGRDVRMPCSERKRRRSTFAPDAEQCLRVQQDRQSPARRRQHQYLRGHRPISCSCREGSNFHGESRRSASFAPNTQLDPTASSISRQGRNSWRSSFPPDRARHPQALSITLSCVRLMGRREAFSCRSFLWCEGEKLVRLSGRSNSPCQATSHRNCVM